MGLCFSNMLKPNIFKVDYISMNISVYLPKDLAKEVKNAASRNQRSVSQFVRLAVINSLNKRRCDAKQEAKDN